MSDPNPEDYLPLSQAVFHILLALADGERHGYAIMQEVKRRTGGGVKIGPGTLYGSIKRLLESGLIQESEARPDPDLDDERRRYYRLTDFGRLVAKAEARRIMGLIEQARGKNLFEGPAAIEGSR
jgi:DNA-binding PadR family transcriptional regulator